jgi:hypothetical protein
MRLAPDRVAEHADPLDLDLNDVAVTQRAHPGRGPGEDRVAGILSTATPLATPYGGRLVPKRPETRAERHEFIRFAVTRP